MSSEATGHASGTIRRARNPRMMMDTKEFARRQGVNPSRIRQLILEGRLYPAPVKVGRSYAIDHDTIILRAPERNRGFTKIRSRLNDGTMTDRDVSDFVHEARYWINRGVSKDA